MAFIGKAKKLDLVGLTTELGMQVPRDAKIINLKEILIKCKNVDELFVKEYLAAIISNRIEGRVRKVTAGI